MVKNKTQSDREILCSFSSFIKVFVAPPHAWCICPAEGRVRFWRQTVVSLKRRLIAAPMKVDRSFTLCPRKLLRFRRACKRLPKLKKPLPTPAILPVAKATVAEKAGGLKLEQLGLAAMPLRKDGSVVDWGAQVVGAWRTSEQDALRVLDDFLQIGEGFGGI